MKMYKFLAAAAALALTVGMTSCNDDDTTYDFPGVDGQVVISPTVNAAYKIVKTPVGYVTPTIDWAAEARCRVPAEEEISVKFEIDNSLVDTYNTENGLADEEAYVALPDGLVTLVVPAPVVDEPVETASRASEGVISIEEGKTASSVKIQATFNPNDNLLAGLDLSTKYMVPVRMTEVVKGKARIGVSQTNISYLTFTLSEDMINQNGSPTGTIVPKEDRQNWSGTEGDGATEWYGWDYPIKYERNYAYGIYYEGASVTFDFGKEMTYDGVYAYPFYGISSYALFRAGSELFSSNDGTNWTSLGTLESWKTTVTFYGPVTSRYFKVVLGSGNYMACTAFSIYEVK